MALGRPVLPEVKITSAGSSSWIEGNKVSETPNESTSSANKLRELNQLYKEGVITKKEFVEAKKKYL